MPVKAHPPSKASGKSIGVQQSGRRVTRMGERRRRRSLSGPSLHSGEFESSEASEGYIHVPVGLAKYRIPSAGSEASSWSGDRPSGDRNSYSGYSSCSDKLVQLYENIVSRVSSPSGDHKRRPMKQASVPQGSKPLDDRMSEDNRSMRTCHPQRRTMMSSARKRAAGGDDGCWTDGAGGRGEGRSRANVGCGFGGHDGRGRSSGELRVVDDGICGCTSDRQDEFVDCRSGGGDRSRVGGLKRDSPSGSFTKSGEPSSQMAYQTKMSPLTSDNDSEHKSSPKRRNSKTDDQQTARLPVWDANSSNQQPSNRRRTVSRNSPVSNSPTVLSLHASPPTIKHRQEGKSSKYAAAQWDENHSNQGNIYKQGRRRDCRQQSPQACQMRSPAYDTEMRCTTQARRQNQKQQPSIYTGNHVESYVRAPRKSESLRDLYSLRSQYYNENDCRQEARQTGRRVLSWEDSDRDETSQRILYQQVQDRIAQTQRKLQQQHQYLKVLRRKTMDNQQTRVKRADSPAEMNQANIYSENEAKRRNRQCDGSYRRQTWHSRPKWQASSADSYGFDDAVSMEEAQPPRTRCHQNKTTWQVSGSTRRNLPTLSPPGEPECLDRDPSVRTKRVLSTDVTAVPGGHWCDRSGRMHETRCRRQTLISCPYMSLSLQAKTYECDRCAGYLAYTNNLNSNQSRLWRGDTASPGSLASRDRQRATRGEAQDFRARPLKQPDSRHN